MNKVCAVCGDTHPTNVRLIWQRFIDGAKFNVCLHCAEIGRVDAQTVNNFPSGKIKEEAKEQ